MFSKYKILAVSLFLIVSNFLPAQELNCQISVISSQIQGSNKSVFETLQKDLYEFLNTRNWTNNVFSTEERIECNFLLTLSKQISVDEFEGSLQVTSSRPVYNSGYSSPILNLKDDNVRFKFAEGETLEFNDATHNDLTSLFAYYVYIILGFDYDTFSPMGGTQYFEEAEKIVSTAQSSAYKGWKSFESRKNRYWLTENLLNKVYAPIRQYEYTYHRKGLDIMSTKVAEGRTAIATGINDLLQVQRQKSNSFLMQIFFDAKRDEIIKILKESPSSEAMRAINVLKEVDPANASKYQDIIKKQ